MDISDFKKLLAKGEIEEVITALLKDPGNLSKTLKKKALVISTRYQQLQINIHKGIISEEKAILESNRINDSLLHILTRLDNLVSQENLQEIRQGLREIYENRINSKLAARFPINLELKYSTEGTTSRAALYDNRTIRSTKIKDELITLFDKHRGRLLIIGEPGSGKTTLLLQLALKLLEKENARIPIVINIATWRERFSSVQEWLTELLPQMGFSKGLTKNILTEDRLLPLFDGLDELDELDEEYRQTCLEAIGEYGKNQNSDYIICSRIQEYAQGIDAPVYCQIMVKPLTLQQIQISLKEQNSPETRGILDAIGKDTLISDAIKTPFYLNIIQQLFASMKSWDEFGFRSGSLEGRKKEIVECFIQSSTKSITDYSSIKVKKWLSFLAYRMNDRNDVTFELVNLQYDWIIINNFQLFIAKILKGIVGGLVIGIVVGLFGSFIGSLILISELNLNKGLTEGILTGLAGGILTGLILGLFISLIVGLTISLSGGSINILTKDRVNWSLSTFRKSVKKYLSFGLVLSLILFLTYDSLYDQIYILTVGTHSGSVTDFSLIDSLKGYFYDFFYGIITGVISCLILDLAVINIFNGTKSALILLRRSFQEVLVRSLIIGLTIAALYWVIFDIVLDLLYDLVDGLVFDLIESLISGITIGMILSVILETVLKPNNYAASII
ncbi:NACHT domain-containing protein [Flavilitoribacter nigricans]|uniref:NACHT domain-containing protein n=1 Tax=Flavilitoribacter nigricans (strain ATCC 23147 / DSM 23189 / NBRC 102662 / NCIMB 1420 / SS-2) TaxID=1122177 RepID=A0A2D0MWY7_FLAN2|nr:NACHT domain-containing protein [Flavilitoribacter nigricans]PHN00774.1 hypothetical protein CRP01_40430 [Flavilitoribacter nigricans DSM 23189 = NBRC 102662]